MKETVLEKLKKNYEEFKTYTIMEERQLLERTLEGVEDTIEHDSNEIMVYMGTYYTVYESDTIFGGEEVLLQDDETHPRMFKKFIDLENGFEYRVRIKDCKMFESEHIVVYIPNARNFANKYTYLEDYKKLRRIFFKKAIENGQESAIRLIASQDNIDKIFSVENFVKEHKLDTLDVETFKAVALSSVNPVTHQNDSQIIEDCVKRLQFRK